MLPHKESCCGILDWIPDYHMIDPCSNPVWRSRGGWVFQSDHGPKVLHKYIFVYISKIYMCTRVWCKKIDLHTLLKTNLEFDASQWNQSGYILE